MAAAEKHPTDAGKYQATFSDYGHGKGNGKSRSAVYKEYKRFQNVTHDMKIESQENVTHDMKVESQREVPHSDPIIDDTKSSIMPNDDTKSDEIPIQDDTKSDVPPTSEEETADFVQQEWGQVGWADDADDSRPVKPNTIPSPIQRLGTQADTAIDKESTGKLIRYLYVGIDRMLSHWGRAIMSDPKWSIDRSVEDYDALEDSTTRMLNHYGIEIPVSPVLVWGVTVGAAYTPPVTHIVRNADPKRRGFFARFNPFRRRKKATQNPSKSIRMERTDEPKTDA